MKKGSVANTSLKAYLQKKREGTLTEDQEIVYQIIKKHGPITLKQTARRLNRFPHEISGRFTELRTEKHMIEINDVKDGHRRYQVTQKR